MFRVAWLRVLSLTVMYCVDCRYVAAHSLHDKGRHFITDIALSQSAKHPIVMFEGLTHGLPVARC
jgi:hypothetical protein